MTDPTETEAVWAEPYTTRQCPECETWVYVANGPFAEGDPTKTLADWLHWQRLHLDEDHAATTIGFPYFFFNETPVQATIEASAAERSPGAGSGIAGKETVVDRLDQLRRGADPDPAWPPELTDEPLTQTRGEERSGSAPTPPSPRAHWVVASSSGRQWTGRLATVSRGLTDGSRSRRRRFPGERESGDASP